MLFPKHLLEVPGLVGDVSRYINKTSIKAQPILALGAALAFCGTIMGRKVQTRTQLRPNIYVIGVADSGSGKENARTAIKRLFADAGAPTMVGAEDLASDAGLFTAVHRQPSCLLLVDEIGRFWKAVTAANAPQHKIDIGTLLMKFTGSAVSSIPDKVRADPDAVIRIIQQPNVCMYGTTVPGRLFESIKLVDVTDGFYPRVLVLHSDDPDPFEQEPGDSTPDAGLIDLIRSWIARPVNAYPSGHDLADLRPNPLYVDMSPEADQWIAAYEAENRGRRGKTRGTGIDAMWNRAREHARRLSLIRACGRDFDAPMIQIDDAQWACELVTFVFDRAIAEIGTHVSENEHEAIIKKVLDFVSTRGTVQKSVLGKKFQQYSKSMPSVLTALQENGDISIGLEIRDEGATGRTPIVVTWTGGENGQKEGSQ